MAHDSDPPFSLRSMAQHLPFIDTSNDQKRLHIMYENFYRATDFADVTISNIFEQYAHTEYAEYAIPLLMQILVVPQYAIRAFFKAYDTCELDRVEAERLWDIGVAALAGSIEGESAEGNEGENGRSWYALAEEQCRLFHCGDGDFSNPIYRQKMMDNVKFGRDFIRSGRCNALHNRLVSMESLLITPLLQGTLYHTYMAKESNEASQRRKNYARGFAYGAAIIPFLTIANKEDAEIVGDALLFKETSTITNNILVKVWEAILLSLGELGVDCKHVGRDTLGVLDLNMSFCDIGDDITPFPTSSPFPTAERRPSSSPSPSASPSTEAQLLYNEIDGSFKTRYTFTDLDDANNK